MSKMPSDTAVTLLDALRISLMSAAKFALGEAAPAVILWPDPDGQWPSLMPQLQTMLPQLFVLGEYLPQARKGPAIWLRCVIERTLLEVAIPENATPILYLPEVSRQMLRSAEDCPGPYLPLVELQYRGNVWCQRNGKDWTVEAFLVSEDSGMQLDIAKDAQTRAAMLGALAQLAVTPVSRLRDKRLEAEDFDKLMIEDTPRKLLEWMNDPRGVRERWDLGQWTAFCSRCKAEYKFDPERDGELVAGERLGMREAEWHGIWQRFADAPALYPGLPELLRRARPSGLAFIKETWPTENDEAEQTLRKALADLAHKSAAEARAIIQTLEVEHGPRRQWVWAKLGESPLAKALAHLLVLANRTTTTLGGETPVSMAETYTLSGYLADDAVLRALAEVKSVEDCNAVTIAVRAMYLPWLQNSAEHFQKLVSASPLPTQGSSLFEAIEATSGMCIMFVDGLRFDLGQRLAQLAADRQMRVRKGRRWAAVPTVTATAKPAVTPVTDQIVGHRLGESFAPELSSSGQAATANLVRKLMVDAGYQCLGPSETGQPKDGRAWTEYGEFDSLGHKLQLKLANQIDQQLDLLLDRVQMLLDAGWRDIRIVTDHGWLLVPGGIPSNTLPKYLTESRWARCATVKAGAHVTVPTAGWFWNPVEVFAFGAGISCLGNGGVEYAHGGISLQECVIPDITISSDATVVDVATSISSVQWVGMRCRIVISPPGGAFVADIRTKVGDPATSITTPKNVDTDGRAGLLVESDLHEGVSASVVIINTSGQVVAKYATIVGGEE